MTFILIQGSWHTGEAWYKMENSLRQAGYNVFAPTLTGFEAGGKPGGPDVGLNTNIEDIMGLVDEIGLDELILVGHSYSGLIISGVAELIPGKINKLIYLDAFIPDDNQSLFDLLGPASEAGLRKSLVDAEGKTQAEGATQIWLLPPGKPQDYGVTDPVEAEWLQPRMVYTSVLTFEEKVRLRNLEAEAISRYFIRCTEFPYKGAYEKKALSLGWPTFSIKPSHDAMLTNPVELTAILQKIADHNPGLTSSSHEAS